MNPIILHLFNPTIARAGESKSRYDVGVADNRTENASLIAVYMAME
jgi:hypothetical protein